MKSLNKTLCDQDYIEGVYDERSGKERMRPLTENEAAWLTQFNREYYASFGLKEPGTLHPPEYHKQLYKDAHHRRNDVLNQKTVVESLDELKKKL